MVTVGLYEIEIVCVFLGEDVRDVRFGWLDGVPVRNDLDEDEK